jgi:hypothetical protein
LDTFRTVKPHALNAHNAVLGMGEAQKVASNTRQQ